MEWPQHRYPCWGHFSLRLSSRRRPTFMVFHNHQCCPGQRRDLDREPQRLSLCPCWGSLIRSAPLPIRHRQCTCRALTRESKVGYLSAVWTVPKVVFRLVPRPFTTEMIATEIPAAMSPYSMAVAPDSSLTNRIRNLYIVISRLTLYVHFAALYFVN